MCVNNKTPFYKMHIMVLCHNYFFFWKRHKHAAIITTMAVKTAVSGSRVKWNTIYVYRCFWEVFNIEFVSCYIYIWLYFSLRLPGFVGCVRVKNMRKSRWKTMAGTQQEQQQKWSPKKFQHSMCSTYWVLCLTRIIMINGIDNIHI